LPSTANIVGGAVVLPLFALTGAILPDRGAAGAPAGSRRGLTDAPSGVSGFESNPIARLGQELGSPSPE
jgi:hypothetical protein